MLTDLVPLISQHLPLTPVVEMTDYPDRQALSGLLASPSPNICFLDVVSQRTAGFNLIASLNSLNPAMQVVVLLNANEPDLILRCLRQGASEFLMQPFSSDQLQPVLDRLAQLTATRSGVDHSGARIYCVMPVKGACGASTIASNLAFQWRRLGAKKNLLADMDPMTGTVSFLMKIKSNYSFMDALSRGDSLDSDLWKGLVTNFQGVDVLLSPENPLDGIQELPDPGSVLEFCRQAYETVTIDTGDPSSAWSLSLAGLCDVLLLVTSNELPSLRATQRALHHFDKNRIDRAKIRLVINRYNSTVGLNQEAIETALHNDVYQVVPFDYEAVQRALVDGRPVAAGSAFGKNLIALADRLSGQNGAGGSKDKKKQSSLSALFSSLVSRSSS